MKIIIWIAFLSFALYPSESPQRDLYKIDYRDHKFNQACRTMASPDLKDQYRVLFSESGNSQGVQLIRDLIRIESKNRATN